MTDRPIIFSGPMVRALLDGSKTQTRRLLKPQPMADCYFDGTLDLEQVYLPDDMDPNCYARFSAYAVGGGAIREQTIKLPIAVGDRLWVGEAHWALGYWITTDELTKTGKRKRKFVRDFDTNVRVDPPSVCLPDCDDDRVGWYARRGRFMFKADSRLTLTVTDVRVQKLQDITEADAVAEGIAEVSSDWPKAPFPSYKAYGQTACFSGARSARLSFMTLWDSLNANRAPWNSNPWVIAYTFTVQHGNIDGVKP